jgi:acetyltransferase-like isoleucine patch superfamily enzyme
MGFIIGIFNHLYRKFLSCASEERRINFLRRQGVKIGANCRICTMSFSTEPFLIEIGDNVAVSDGAQFITHDGSVRCFGGDVNGGLFGRIKIGNNTFIGTGCIILLNTTIGNNCIVGAGSVLRGRFPDNSVITGNPAKVVSTMNIQKMCVERSTGFVRTNNLPPKEAQRRVKEHFGIVAPKSGTSAWFPRLFTRLRGYRSEST